MIAIKDIDKTQPYDLTLDLVKPGNGDIVNIIYVYHEDKVRPMELKDKISKFETYYNKRLKEDGLLKSGSKFMPTLNQIGVSACNLFKYIYIYIPLPH